jgi:hypothetical protein
MELLFVHNTYNRTKALYKNIATERSYFPDAHFLVLYNNKDLAVNHDMCRHIYIGPNQGHKLACLNSAIEAIQRLVDDYPSIDALIFSHDDVVLYDFPKFQKALSKLEEGHDFIGRKFARESNYIMMEIFIMHRSIPEKFHFKQVEYLLKDSRGSLSPERSFGELVTASSKNPFFYYFNKNSYGLNEMGYFHHDYKRGCGDGTIKQRNALR